MDVRIGEMKLAGHIVGRAGARSHADVVDALTGEAYRRTLLDATEGAFDVDDVVVIRSLACRLAVRLDAAAPPGQAVARAIVSSAVQCVRDHSANDDVVVHFENQAAFVASFIGDALRGSADRWYFSAFTRYQRADGSADWIALLDDHHEIRWDIVADLHRRGDLDAFTTVIGDEGVQLLVGDDIEHDARQWEPLVASAGEIVHRGLGRRVSDSAIADAAGSVASELASEAFSPDWRDPMSLGHAVGTAARGVLARSVGDPGGRETSVRRDRLIDAASGLDWVDQQGFDSGLRGAFAGGQSPRTRQVLADLLDATRDPLLRLDPRRPDRADNLIRLVAVLVQRAPQWRDDDLARSVAAHTLRRWAHDRTADDRSEATRMDALLLNITTSLATRFPLHFGGNQDSARSETGSALLLLRAAHDIGLAPLCLHTVEEPNGLLLSALLRRWAGAVDRSTSDPILNLLDEIAAKHPSATVLDRAGACAVAARRLLGQRIVVDPLRTITVPFGVAELATVVLDAHNRLLPIGSLDDPEEARRSLLALGYQIEAEPAGGPAAEVVAEVADVFMAFDDAGLTHLDRQSALDLDLLAIACVQAWTRWLPGFHDARVPFVMDKFIRRPARVHVEDDSVEVHLAPRSHDVVLDMAGYLKPFEAGSSLGRRRLCFTVETDDEL